MKRLNCYLLLVLCLILTNSAFASEDVVKRGRALQTAGNFEEALQLYSQSLSHQPTAEVYIEAGTLMGKLQQYDNAEQLLKSGINQFPENTSVKNLLALIHYRQGKRSEALALLEQVLAADAQNSFAQNWAKTIRAEMSPARSTTASEAPSSDSTRPQPVYRPSSSGRFAINTDLDEEQQKARAVELYQQMIELEKWEIDQFKSLHREVIERCPTTPQAEESCWRLSNLYLLGEDPPNHQGIIDVLEHYVEHYSDSPLYPNVVNRLMLSYKATGNSEKLVELYQDLFTRDPDPIDEATFMARALEFADALYVVGRHEEAQAWYMRILERDAGRNLLQARVARDRLAGL